MNRLKIGDVIDKITGLGVVFPYDTFRYRVTSLSPSTIGLEIINTESKDSNG